MTIYGIECALALALMLLVAGLWCRRSRVGYGPWITLCAAAIPLALVGSRLFFGLTSLGMGDMTNPVQVFFAWDGGASITGAFAGAVLAAFLVEKGCKLPHGQLMDGLALGAPLAIIVARMGEPPFEVGVGRIVDTEFLAFLGNMTDGRHPVFLYEAAWALVIAVALALYAIRSTNRRQGDILLTFLALYGSAQMLFESLRDDAHMVIYFIRINQIAALVMVVIAFVVWTVRVAKRCRKRRSIIGLSVLMALAIVKGVIQEFAVDSDPNLLWEYAQMALCVAFMAGLALSMRRLANLNK